VNSPKTKKNVLAIIPARKGSKRVERKNTRLLAGIPLIEYVLRAATQSKLITTLVVSSDDDEVASITSRYPSAEFIPRPAHLSTDTSPAIDYVRHALEHKAQSSWNLIVIIQPTTPFVRPEDIDGTIALAIENDVPSAVSVMKIGQLHHPWKLKTMRGSMLEPFMMEEKNIRQAQELPELYTRNGGVYVTTMETISKGLIIDDPCLGFVMPSDRSVDINDPIDFDFAEFLAARYHLNS
jgi:CMP-N,N'-diacetyllegionaminic acid synthase